MSTLEHNNIFLTQHGIVLKPTNTMFVIKHFEDDRIAVTVSEFHDVEVFEKKSGKRQRFNLSFDIATKEHFFLT